ncbi:MAG: hypothetical protein M0Z59_08380 [Nitrospiraceae bacterium]|nr:hypothetical protein [Nitrospiraceae bacterium]
MDRFVKNFIFMSIVYLVLASFLGVAMLLDSDMLAWKFVHSHLMLLGWVSMMIYGVGYHILPRFAGRLLKSKAMAEVQFWLANAGLTGMLLFYMLDRYHPETAAYKSLSGLFGGLEVVSIALFFYNLVATVYSKGEGE